MEYNTKGKWKSSRLYAAFQSKDILESHIGGPIQLTKYIKIVCDNESEIEGYTKKAF